MKRLQKTKMIYLHIISAMLLCTTFCTASATLDMRFEKWYVGVFTHVEASPIQNASAHHSSKDQIEFGETSLLTRGNITPKLTLLTEHTFELDYDREDNMQLVRLLLRHELAGDHWA